MTISGLMVFYSAPKKPSLFEASLLCTLLLRYPWRDRLTIVSDPRHVLAPQMQWKIELGKNEHAAISTYESIHYCVSGGFWKLVAGNHEKGVYIHRFNAECMFTAYIYIYIYTGNWFVTLCAFPCLH